MSPFGKIFYLLVVLMVFGPRFRTAAGREFCIDSHSSWVNSHIAKVNSRRTTSTTAKTLSTTV